VFAEMIAEDEYVAAFKNPNRDDQKIVLCRYRNYIHVVPYVTDMKGNIVLKTVYPSRKFQKQYGGQDNE